MIKASLSHSGEIHELKEELRNVEKAKKKEAVKKVIAFMTVGKDVSMLFPDVVNCMQTEDLELKKLVYLYLINYAKSQPDLCIMAVNTFVKVNGPSLSHIICVRSLSLICHSGLARPKPSDPFPGSSDHGMHSS